MNNVHFQSSLEKEIWPLAIVFLVWNQVGGCQQQKTYSAIEDRTQQIPSGSCKHGTVDDDDDNKIKFKYYIVMPHLSAQ